MSIPRTVVVKPPTNKTVTQTHASHEALVIQSYGQTMSVFSLENSLHTKTTHFANASRPLIVKFQDLDILCPAHEHLHLCM